MPTPAFRPPFDTAQFLWVTNGGSAEITANSIASLVKVTPSARGRILVATLDDQASSIVASHHGGIQIHAWQDLASGSPIGTALPVDYHNIGTTEFNRVSAVRYAVIAALLAKSSAPLFYTDGDIAYLNDPIAYFGTTNEIDFTRVLFQSDRNSCANDDAISEQPRPGRRPRGSTFCTGFSVWQPLPTHIALADMVIRGLAAEGYARNDQLVLNSFFFLRLRNAQLLRQDRFPNGSLVFKETGFERPNLDMSKVVLVHANWMEGLPLKTKALKAAGYWHL